MRKRTWSSAAIDELAHQATAGNGQRALSVHFARWPLGRFFPGTELGKVPIARRAAASLIARLNGAPRGASWGDDDFIVLATLNPPVCSACQRNGGETKRLTQSDPTKGEFHGFPHVLPGSKAVLFTVLRRPTSCRATVEAARSGDRRRKTVISKWHRCAPTSFRISGLRDLSFLADARQPLSRVVAGRAFRFVTRRDGGDSVSRVRRRFRGNHGRGELSDCRGAATWCSFQAVSSTRTPTANALSSWVDRKGQETPIGAPSRTYATARLSPDGTRIALDVRDQTNDIWIWDINRQTLTHPQSPSPRKT